MFESIDKNDGVKKMKKNRMEVKEWVIASFFVALGIMLPMLFHTVGIAGPIFLPMHIPVLIAGFILSPWLALFVGIIIPLLSSVLTGMPILFPMAVVMMFELGAYGFIVSLISRSTKWNIILTLLSSMIVGRIVAGMTVFILVQGFGIKMNALMFVKGSIITGLPGIALQIVLIPVLVSRIKLFYNVNKYKEQEI